MGRIAVENDWLAAVSTNIPGREQQAATLRNWVTSIDESDASELSLEPMFLTTILCGVLGYTLYPGAAGVTATLYSKPSRRLTGISKCPDAALGAFVATDQQFVGVVELKSPGTDLDLPQTGYDYESPVAQGFYAGSRILGVRWVVVSDMKVIRLYSVDSQDEYEELKLSDCVTATGEPTEELRRLYFLLHYDYLVHGDDESQVSLLYGKSADRQIAIRNGFYDAYYRIRADLYDAIRESASALTHVPSPQQLLEATQRLLDRLLFIFYCEDHPQQLIPKNTVKTVTDAARGLPGGTNTRVYGFLKALFKEIDAGSPRDSGLKVPGYNGELFKHHRIIDNIDLPDSLHDKKYETDIRDGTPRHIEGVWGLHVFDFWSELNEHLLGHIFEESLSDLADLGSTSHVSERAQLDEKLSEQKRFGIFYTTSILSDFLCASAMQALLNEASPITGTTADELIVAIRNRLRCLLRLRTVDFACGSGAFLVSLFRELLQEFWRLRSSLAAGTSKTDDIDMFSAAEPLEEAKALPSCIFGVDLLPQATEIAKLAIWLRSARKDEKVMDLSKNIIACDSLDVPRVFEQLGVGAGSFDLVVGNPPWGGDVGKGVLEEAVAWLGLPCGSKWDTWELFVLLGLRALRDGGRLAVVLPDSFLYPQKAALRRRLFEQATLEKVHNLGPDWFGKKVRMGTVVIQARRGAVNAEGSSVAMMLGGELRQRAIAGKVPLTQIEAQLARLIPIERTLRSPSVEVEVFRGIDDDRIIATMESHGSAVESLCKRGRGEEINKSGWVWVCPSCLAPTTPGEKLKGGGYDAKKCPGCGCELTAESVQTQYIVIGPETLLKEKPPAKEIVPFIDGDDVNRRYRKVVPDKSMWIGLDGWKYKDAALYKGPKLLVRQAGIGVSATLDMTDARCPQSVYVYRLREEELEKGYKHEFVLAALLSRTMAFLVFKRFSEVDSAKAHPKLTHDRLAKLPIPRVDFSRAAEKKAHGKVVAQVQLLLGGKAQLGGSEDREIEQILRELWGIPSEDGAYINGEFFVMPDSQVLRDLFPQGAPKPVRREEIGEAGGS